MALPLEQMIEEYQSLMARGQARDDGWTRAEIIEQTGWSQSKVDKLLHHAFRNGMLIVGQRPMPTITGIMRPVPVYIWKKPAKNKRGKKTS